MAIDLTGGLPADREYVFPACPDTPGMRELKLTGDAPNVELRGKKVELVVFGRMGHSILLEDQEREFYARLLQFLDANIGASTSAGWV